MGRWGKKEGGGIKHPETKAILDSNLGASIGVRDFENKQRIFA